MTDLSKYTLAELEAEIERRKAEPDYAAWEPKWQAFLESFGLTQPWPEFKKRYIRALIAAHNTPLAGEWTEYRPLETNIGPIGVSVKTHDIQFLNGETWLGVDPEWLCNARYRYRLKQTDGWIPWVGGECPVLGGTVVDMKFIGIASAERAENWGWGAEQISQIIAYRVVKEP